MFNILIPIFILFLLLILVGSPILAINSWIRTRKLERKLKQIESLLSSPKTDLKDSSIGETTSIVPQTESIEAISENIAHAANGDSTIGDAVADAGSGVSETQDDLIEASPKQSIEEKLGGSWAVWIGGLALFLGGIFLVRFALDSDLIDERARLILGGIFAIVMISAAEWLRRRTSEQQQKTFGQAYIPGILTLVGTTTAFATVYVAHANYGYLGDAAAFVIFGLVAISTLMAALVHGPAVASYGLVACYVVPFLVSSTNPSLLPLAFYGLFVSIAAYSVARLRLWRWLAIGAVAGSLFWGHVLAFFARISDNGILVFYDIAVFALAAYIFVLSLHPRDSRLQIIKVDKLAFIVIGLHTLLFFYLLQVDDFGLFSLTVSAIVCILLLFLASEYPNVSPFAYISAGFALISYLSFDVDLYPQDIQTQAPLLFPRIASAFSNPDASGFLTFGAVLAFLTGVGGFVGALRSSGRTALSTASVLAPIGLILIAYFRISEFETSTFFGLASLVLSIAYLFACVLLERIFSEDAVSRNGSIVAYSIGTVSALVVGFSILLEHGWFTLSLAIIAMGVSWVGNYRRMVALPWISVAVAILCIASIAYQPTIVAIDELGTTPILNWLLVGYGVPAIAFGVSSWLVSLHSQGLPQKILTSMCIFMSLLTGIVLIHHSMNPNDFYAPADTLAERSLITVVLLAGSLSLQGINLRKYSSVYEHGSTLLGVVSFVLLAIDHLYNYNPLHTGEYVGDGMVFNLNFFGFLLPSIFAGLIAIVSRFKKPKWYTWSAGVAALLLLFFYISIQVRTFFQGPVLNSELPEGGELYTLTVAWILLGVMLLIAGLLTNIRELRLGSAVIVTVSILTIFIYGINNLEGVLRALAFIGLGVVLVGIGLIYQRILKPKDFDAESTADNNAS